MKIRNVVLICLLVLGLVATGVTIAQNVSPVMHPNLAAAQGYIDQAVGKIDAAQHANEYDMDGHAAHAKELLMQAREEIKLAARAANHHHQ
ncbi:MAG: hypothetical protein ABSF70_12570 [Terracidiphilus sp.]|jgi:hypothetical protein